MNLLISSDFFQTYNMNEIMGRILGLLLSSTSPLSLNSISEQLELSKASISIQIRKLEEIGYCKKSPKMRDRKDYYFYNEEFIQWIMLSYIASKEKNQKLFEGLVNETIERKEDFLDGEEYEVIKERLVHIKEFNDVFIKILKTSFKEWEENIKK